MTLRVAALARVDDRQHCAVLLWQLTAEFKFDPDFETEVR